MEEIEVPTEHLHEEIQERAEERKEKWILFVALSTAVMAVLAAVAGLLAGHHANEALIERVKASDQWNLYQSKSVKQEIAINTDLIMHTQDHSAAIAKYDKDKADAMKDAKEAEKESEEHLSKHVPLASAVTAFQIAIAISAIAILTRRKVLWVGGLVLTCIGIVFFVLGILP
jgi:predicted histidine transporter YuiF (NhaC family)